MIVFGFVVMSELIKSVHYKTLEKDLNPRVALPLLSVVTMKKLNLQSGRYCIQLEWLEFEWPGFSIGAPECP